MNKRKRVRSHSHFSYFLIFIFWSHHVACGILVPQTGTTCLGSTESQALDSQGSPIIAVYNLSSSSPASHPGDLKGLSILSCFLLPLSFSISTVEVTLTSSFLQLQLLYHLLHTRPCPSTSPPTLCQQTQALPPHCFSRTASDQL